MKIILVVGTRPNFMKAAPVWEEFKQRPEKFQLLLVHTGQHYDRNMSKVFFDELGLPRPDRYLGVGSGSHAVQTARIMEGFEKVLLEESPDMVMVFGDVNSTLACSLDAVKLHIPVSHVEAGLRSRDRSMPEEINRIVTDSISDILFTPSADADENLKREGIPEERIFRVGNVMIDSLRRFEAEADRSDALQRLGVAEGKYALLTLHRPSNVDEEEVFRGVLSAIERISQDIEVVFPVHPRTRKVIEELLMDLDSIKVTEPVGYTDFLKLQKEAMLVLTDSGGIQEETMVFDVPCLTLRQNTERPITVEFGTNILVGNDPDRIVSETHRILNGEVKRGKVPELWDGRTAERIVDVIDGGCGFQIADCGLRI